MTIKLRMRRCAMTATVLVGLGMGLSIRECHASTTESLAAGAITCAAELFQDRASQKRAEKLLRFGLAFDPDNTRGLLMQARLERNRDPIEEPPETSVRKRYLQGVLRLAERTSSEPHKLLLYRVVELLDPENEIALVALTKARNDGLDIDFYRLLEKVTGNSAKRNESTLGSTVGGRAEEENKEVSPQTRADASASSLSKSCRDLINEANPLRALRRKRDADAITRDLGELRIGAFPPDGTTMYSLDWLNELNRRLVRRGYVVVPFCNETFSLSAVDFTDAGVPQFSGSLRKYPAMRTRQQTSRKLGHFLAEVCSGMKTGYRIVDGAILLTAPEHADNQACASVCKAGDLVKEFSENHLEARKRYRNQFLVVEGRVSGTGRSVSGAKVMLDNGRVDLYLGSDADVELDGLNVGRTVRAVGRFSHNNLDRIIIKDCILTSQTHY